MPASFSDPAGPFLYNLAGDNRLSATFNTFLIKVGTSVYKLQFTGYYDAMASGSAVMLARVSR